MAKISTGNFGLVAPQAAPGADTSSIGRAVEGLGHAVSRVGLIVNEKRQQAARAESANAYLDHQIGVKTIAEEVADELATGKLGPDDAPDEYQRRVAKLKRPEIAHLTSIDQMNLERGMKRNAFEASRVVDSQAEVTRRARFKANFDGALDKLGKLSGMPNADIEGINQQAAAFREMGIAAGYSEPDVDRAIQNFKDQNWLNHATQRALESAESLKALRELKKDLTAEDGYYHDKLDTNKRNGVLRAVLSDMQQLQNRLEHQADRRESRAAVTMNNLGRQIASGVPLTADMWAEAATVVSGTSFAPDFNGMVDAEEEVQEVLRLPLDKQIAYANEKEATLLQSGGTLQDKANVDRLQAVVEESKKLMTEAPLQFQANRNGEPVVPIDLSALADPDSTQVAKQLQERVVTLGAMQKQYGDQVPMKPLMPQEAAALAAALNRADARSSAALFATVRNAVNDDAAYQGIMQQIAPDAPVKSYAGLLAARQRSMTLERNWLSNDVVASSPDVAATLLRGLEVMQPSKNAKGEDGSPKVGLYLPAEADKDLQREFASSVGNAFAGRPDAAEKAYQAVRAYYVGAAVERGKMAENTTDVDSSIVRRAVMATLGEVVDYNGNGEVLAPWGMSGDEFEDRVQVSFLAEAKARNLPPIPANQFGTLGLKNNGDGRYFVTQGRNYILDEQGDPLVINVLQPVTGGK